MKGHPNFHYIGWSRRIQVYATTIRDNKPANSPLWSAAHAVLVAAERLEEELRKEAE